MSGKSSKDLRNLRDLRAFRNWSALSDWYVCGERAGMVLSLLIFLVLVWSFGVQAIPAGAQEQADAGQTSAEGNEESLGELLPVWDTEKISILTNHDSKPIRFWTENEKRGPRTERLLLPGETMALANPQSACAVFERNGELVRLRLLQDEIYLFVRENGVMELIGIGPDFGLSVPQSRIQGREEEQEISSEFESQDDSNSVEAEAGAEGAQETGKIASGKAESGQGASAQEKPSQADGGRTGTEAVSGKTSGIPVLKVPVRIFTDLNIPLAEKLWQKRITDRLQKASDILEKTCFVRLEILSFQTWESDPQCANLHEVLKNFESKVPVEQGVLAIGFTAHQNAKGHRTELGVARQPFCGRILLREESPQITEVERLETLLHELGHFLGAVHTSDENSLMRTILHERRSRNVNFTISFDPLNALAMNLWVRQFRRGDGKRLRTLHPDVRDQLEVVYRTLQQIAEQQKAAGFPVLENPNVEFFIRMLVKLREVQEARMGIRSSAPVSGDSSAQENVSAAPAEANSASVPKEEVGSNSASEVGAEPAGSVGKSSSESGKSALTDVQKLQKMLKKMTSASWETEKTDEMELPIRTARYILVRTLLALAQNEPLKQVSDTPKSTGDELGERLVRYAAWAAMEVGGTGDADSPEGKAARSAFLLACQILLEPSGAIRKVPIYGRRFGAIETKEIQKIRQKLVGNQVTIYGRTDLSQHFWLSAGLTTQIIPTIVENIGVEKELSDDREGGSGFDVTDLNADVAGTWFASRLMRGTISLEKVGREFEYLKAVPSQIRIPKRLKHPENAEEIQELLLKLRAAVDELQENF